MSNQRKLLESIPTTELTDVTHIDVEVYYTKGGANYFSGGATRRGYYLSAKPVKRDGITVSYNLFSGASKLLLEANRFSVKQFDKAVELGRDSAPELVKHVIKQEKAA